MGHLRPSKEAIASALEVLEQPAIIGIPPEQQTLLARMKEEHPNEMDCLNGAVAVKASLSGGRGMLRRRGIHGRPRPVEDTTVSEFEGMNPELFI